MKSANGADDPASVHNASVHKVDVHKTGMVDQIDGKDLAKKLRFRYNTPLLLHVLSKFTKKEQLWH